MPTTDFTDGNDDWTYEKDAMLILALWILQLFGSICCLGVAMAPLKAS